MINGKGSINKIEWNCYVNGEDSEILLQGYFFGLDPNISCHSENLPILNGEILPILNGESLYDVLYGVLGKYPDSIKWIPIVFICSDDSIKWVSESVEFNTACLFNREYFNFFNEFNNYVREHRDKIKIETGLDSSVVDVIIHDEGEDEDEDD